MKIATITRTYLGALTILFVFLGFKILCMPRAELGQHGLELKDQPASAMAEVSSFLFPRSISYYSDYHHRFERTTSALLW
jgi:hypothetical protein